MHVGLYLVDGVFDSGLAVIGDVLATANALLPGAAPALEPWQVTLLGSSDQVRTRSGLLAATTPPPELTRPLDLLVVPGLGVEDVDGVLAAVTSAAAAPALAFAAGAAAAGVRVAAACSSTFLLAEAGILQGRTATTTWWLGPAFRARYPGVVLDDTRTLVTDGDVTTAGAAFAHVDLALSVVMSASPAVAELVARYLLLDTRASQAAYAMPALLAGEQPLVAAFERWARSRLGGPISIAAAARDLAVSERTLQRSVLRTLGMSPVDFVQELRLDEAVHLLRTTALPAAAVAGRVGYRNVASLRQLVRRRRNTTLGRLRARTAVSGRAAPPAPTAGRPPG